MLDVNSKTYCLDASFILSHLLSDEHQEDVVTILEQYARGNINFISPPILPLEVINGIKYALVRNRITKKLAEDMIKGFKLLIIEIKDIDIEAVFKLSLEKDLTVYDASYLYLSKKEKLPLLTLDEKLKI